MKLELEILNTDNLPDEIDTKRIKDIMVALVSSGGLTGVKGGQTIIHFDALGEFMGVQLSYWPFRRRNNK